MCINHRKKLAILGPWISGVLTVLVMVMLFVAIDLAETQRYQAEIRAVTRDRVSSIRAEIESWLNQRLHLVDGYRDAGNERV